MKSSVVNGKLIALRVMDDLARAYQKLPKKARLGVLVMSPDLTTEKYLNIKRALAARLGVEVVEKKVADDATTAVLTAAVAALAKETDGIVVQLPLPLSVDTDAVLAAIPLSHDVDGIGGGVGEVLPPVVGAMREILAHESQLLFGKKVVIVGKGRLVGKPASVWFESEGSEVVLLEKGDNVALATVDADIVILGAGSPGLLLPEMVKDGVVVLDAGTSESDGKLVGDANPEVLEKARLFTPVPGGVGPVAVAMLFKNLLHLLKNRKG